MAPEAWLDLVSAWVAARPTAGCPEGRAEVLAAILARLEGLGFEARVHAGGAAAPVIEARRGPEAGEAWLGLFAHYDVEEAGEGWTGDPFALRVEAGRAYGRGVADNLGPLALRLLALEERLAAPARAPLPGLLWVIQGEEEIGSPWAHSLFPRLTLPPVALWLEETGYFEEDGAQRLLARRLPARLGSVLDRIEALAREDGRAVRVHDRYLNKAFGESRCPCLAHLVGDAPYVAVGPNDTRSRIHRPDESLPLDTPPLAAAQFLAVLEEVARCA